MRTFDTGATRDVDTDKYDPEGFLSPRALERFMEYMHKHRHQADGKLRDSDNWQKGIPKDTYMKSMWRHFFDTWKEHRGLKSREGIEDALCAIIFNAQGYLHEILKEKEQTASQASWAALQQNAYSQAISGIRGYARGLGSASDLGSGRT